METDDKVLLIITYSLLAKKQYIAHKHTHIHGYTAISEREEMDYC